MVLIQQHLLNRHFFDVVRRGHVAAQAWLQWLVPGHSRRHGGGVGVEQALTHLPMMLHGHYPQRLYVLGFSFPVPLRRVFWAGSLRDSTCAQASSIGPVHRMSASSNPASYSYLHKQEVPSQSRACLNAWTPCDLRPWTIFVFYGQSLQIQHV